MNRKVRTVLLFSSAAVVAAVLLWGYTGLPSFGSTIARYGRVVDSAAQAQRHVTNFVSAVMFDYRGFDTMIEEFILFASVMGVGLLLRSARAVEEQRPHDIVTSDAVRTAGSALAPVVLLFGLWVISFGYISPGGGFQGGLVAAAGALMLWVAGSYRVFRAATPTTLVDATEGFAAASYVGVGLLGLVSGAAFLCNVIPLGSAGTLTSGGSIAALNWVSGVEVAAAFVLLFHELMEEYIQTFHGTKEDK